jgi:8-oxo-dGTP pyrophosphatase MutT (NUDIX family)
MSHPAEKKPERSPPPAVPATTVLLVRPSVAGNAASPPEVFMVVRHHQIDSFSGALVFPGGKLETADGDPRLKARVDGGDALSDAERGFRVAGVREAFEECGILLARKSGAQTLVSAAELAPIEQRWRRKLAEDEASILDMVEAEDLVLVTDRMVPYAHWITPIFAPRRFDTWFFIAEAPEDQVALHDGSESVDSVWINPDAAVEEADAGKRTLVFATRQNLLMLGESDTVADALQTSRARTIVSCQPKVIERDGQKYLTIPPEAGYATSEIRFDRRS